jgi:ankyrin repeat protein
MLALIAHHVDAARLLIEAGAEVNIRSSPHFYGRSALFLAKAGGHDVIAALLKQKGATP